VTSRAHTASRKGRWNNIEVQQAVQRVVGVCFLPLQVRVCCLKCTVVHCMVKVCYLSTSVLNGPLDMVQGAMMSL